MVEISPWDLKSQNYYSSDFRLSFSLQVLCIFSIVPAMCNMSPISVTTFWFDSICMSFYSRLGYKIFRIVMIPTLMLHLTRLRKMKKWTSFLVYNCFSGHSLSLLPQPRINQAQHQCSQKVSAVTPTQGWYSYASIEIVFFCIRISEEISVCHLRNSKYPTKKRNNNNNNKILLSFVFQSPCC